MGEFIARFHPLAVHLPIGFILFAFAFEGIHVYHRTIDAHRKAVSLSYLLAFLASVITVWTGWLLAESALYQPEPLMQHKWAAIWVMMLSLLVFMIKWRPPGALTPWRSLAVSMILVLLVAMAGHLGGSLTHGRDYLWEKAPGWIRNMAGYQPGGPAAALAHAGTP